MQILKYGKDYKLISTPLNPHLYEVKIIGGDGGLTNTNLFFKLATHDPESYTNITLILEDYIPAPTIFDFKGLIIEPASTDTVIELDLGSKIKIKKVKISNKWPVGAVYNVTKPDEAITLLIDKHLGIKEAKDVSIFFNQDGRVIFKDFNIEKAFLFSFYNYTPIKNQEFSICDISNTSISSYNFIENIRAVSVNKSKVRGVNIILNGSTDKIVPIQNVDLSFLNIDRSGGDEHNLSYYRLTGAKEISLKNTTLYTNSSHKNFGSIWGNLDRLRVNDVVLSLLGSTKVDGEDFIINNFGQGNPQRVELRDFNWIKAKKIIIDGTALIAKGLNISMPNGVLEFNNKIEKSVTLCNFTCNDKTDRGLVLSGLYSDKSSIITSEALAGSQTPLISGILCSFIMKDCIIGDNSLVGGQATFNIIEYGENELVSKNFEGVIFEPGSETRIKAEVESSTNIIFKNSIFRASKNEILINNTNLLVTNSEFKNSSIELVGEKNSICSFSNSILENRVEILLITDTKIESSSIKDTILSQVELIKNSSMSNFKSIKRSYKDFNAVISEEAKYIGVVDRLLELL